MKQRHNTPDQKNRQFRASPSTKHQGRIGDIAGLVQDLKEAYLPMLDRGQSCFGEHLGYESSLCHGYNGYLAHAFSRYVAGIEFPDKPGGVIHICPHPEQLSWCQARAPWMGGHVQVWWSQTREEFRLMISLPLGQKGTYIDPITGKITPFTDSISVQQPLRAGASAGSKKRRNRTLRSDNK